MGINSAIDHYKQVSSRANEDINSYELVQMLFTNALNKIESASGHMQRGEIAQKGQCISIAITIIDALQASLDRDKGGELAQNLFKLYHYIMEQLLIANLQNSIEILEHVHQLLVTVKEGWDGISVQAQEIMQQQKTQ